MSFEKKWLQFQFKMSIKFRIELYKQIKGFLKQGISLGDVLSTLSKEFVRYNKNDTRAKIMHYWLEDMSKGVPLSETLLEWSSPSDAMIIKSGEKTGKLDEAFENIIDITLSSKEIKSTIIKEIQYPLLLVFALFGMIIFFSMEVIPKLVEVKDPEQWPDMSKTLYHFSMFIVDYWYILIIVVIIAGTIAGISLSRVTGKFRKFLDYIPPWSIYRIIQSSIFLISVASMMKSGVPLTDTLRGLSEFSNTYMKEHIYTMIKSLSRGDKVGDAMNTGLLTKDMSINVSIYGQLSNIHESIEIIGRQAIKDNIEKVKSAAGMFKTAALMSIGGYIGWMLFAIFTLINSITTSM